MWAGPVARDEANPGFFFFQFVKFANIEEDTPSYHRRYDFFVCQFSAMCHSTHEDPETRTRSGFWSGGSGWPWTLMRRSSVANRIRVAGIRGLQGVVRKTVNDELQAIIWEPQHMDKLIPSMLFNMQDGEDLDRWELRLALLRNCGSTCWSCSV